MSTHNISFHGGIKNTYLYFLSISVSLSPALDTGMRQVSSCLLVLRILNPFITDIKNTFCYGRN